MSLQISGCLANVMNGSGTCWRWGIDKISGNNRILFQFT